MVFYEPAEDSYLLQRFVKKYATGDVLDVGTGSSIQAQEAAKKRSVKNVWAVDIDSEVISYCKEHRQHKKITFVVSDLFSNVKKKQFDTILFNPPYLPEQKGEDKKTALQVSGGKLGYEVLERFLNSARDYLRLNGQILIIFSSLTNKNLVERLIEENGFLATRLGKKSFFMERLYCYQLKIRPEIIFAKKKGVSKIKYFSCGKRGIIFTGLYDGKKIALKIKKGKSTALNKIKNESAWIKRLNKKGIGPHLLFSNDSLVCYEFVEGVFIHEFIQKSSKKNIQKVIKELFEQCFILDSIPANKEEMHHPTKHILVNKGNVVLLDFERMRITQKPKNVTQLVQFICSIEPELKKKGFLINVFSLRRLGAAYKLYPDLAHLNEIIGEIS